MAILHPSFSKNGFSLSGQMLKMALALLINSTKNTNQLLLLYVQHMYTVCLEYPDYLLYIPKCSVNNRAYSVRCCFPQCNALSMAFLF